jgi:hypothetical protein
MCFLKDNQKKRKENTGLSIIRDCAPLLPFDQNPSALRHVLGPIHRPVG